VRPFGETFISKFGLPWGFGLANAAHQLERFCELLVGVILDALVLGLCIFMIVTAFLAALN
jgi:hypothetical protein